MSSEQPPTSMKEDDEALPLATVIPAEQFSAPDVQTWQFGDFKSTEITKTDLARTEVIEQLRQEVAPEMQKQTALIKKEAFEQAQKEGYATGYESGMQQGLDMGKQQAEQEAQLLLTSKISQLDDLLEVMQLPYQRISNEVFQSLISLATQIAEKIVEKEISVDSERILKVVQEAIAILPDEAVSLTVELNPDDLEILEAYQKVFHHKWTFLASENISKGSCRIRHQASIVDNNWRTQLTSLIEQTLMQAQENPLTYSKNQRDLQTSTQLE